MPKRGLLMLCAAAIVAALLAATVTSALAAFPPDSRTAQGTPAAEPAKPGQDADEAQGNPERAIAALAAEFGVSTDVIRARFAAGLGLGEIYRAYDLARVSGQTVDAVLAERAAGQGWGELYRAAGQHPGGHGLGALLGRGHAKDKAKPGAP